jgi:hypothetical protein
MTNHTDTTTEPSRDTVKVRVLRDCEVGQVDDVVLINRNLLPTYSKDSMVDASPEAVAYAESLKN